MMRLLLFIEGAAVLTVMTLVASAVGHALLRSFDEGSRALGFAIFVGLGVVWTCLVLRQWWGP